MTSLFLKPIWLIMHIHEKKIIKKRYQMTRTLPLEYLTIVQLCRLETFFLMAQTILLGFVVNVQRFIVVS